MWHIKIKAVNMSFREDMCIEMLIRLLDCIIYNMQVIDQLDWPNR